MKIINQAEPSVFFLLIISFELLALEITFAHNCDIF